MTLIFSFNTFEDSSVCVCVLVGVCVLPGVFGVASHTAPPPLVSPLTRRLTQLMRMYRGRAEVGSFRLQKPYITLPLSKVSVISARPPPAPQNHRLRYYYSTLTARSAFHASVRLSSTRDKLVKD